ncbi:unnamed protein product [Caenorhabditis sp. 36 PRJEB53466]|nr:unnamed protein product [Caenorhabditis sp. 36 PRJEB53466]
MITADKCLNKDRNAEVDVLKMEQLKALAQELRDHFKRKRLVESSRAFVQILHNLTEFISSLQTVYTMCSSSASKDSCISPGVLDNDFEQMKASKDLIGKRIQEFKLSNFTNPVNPLEWDFLTNVNSILLNCSLCRCIHQKATRIFLQHQFVSPKMHLGPSISTALMVIAVLIAIASLNETVLETYFWGSSETAQSPYQGLVEYEDSLRDDIFFVRHTRNTGNIDFELVVLDMRRMSQILTAMAIEVKSMENGALPIDELIAELMDVRSAADLAKWIQFDKNAVEGFVTKLRDFSKTLASVQVLDTIDAMFNALESAKEEYKSLGDLNDTSILQTFFTAVDRIKSNLINVSLINDFVSSIKAARSQLADVGDLSISVSSMTDDEKQYKQNFLVDLKRYVDTILHKIRDINGWIKRFEAHQEVINNSPILESPQIKLFVFIQSLIARKANGTISDLDASQVTAINELYTSVAQFFTDNNEVRNQLRAMKEVVKSRDAHRKPHLLKHTTGFYDVRNDLSSIQSTCYSFMVHELTGGYHPRSLAAAVAWPMEVLEKKVSALSGIWDGLRQTGAVQRVDELEKMFEEAGTLDKPMLERIIEWVGWPKIPSLTPMQAAYENCEQLVDTFTALLSMMSSLSNVLRDTLELSKLRDAIQFTDNSNLDAELSAVMANLTNSKHKELLKNLTVLSTLLDKVSAKLKSLGKHLDMISGNQAMLIDFPTKYGGRSFISFFEMLDTSRPQIEMFKDFIRSTRKIKDQQNDGKLLDSISKDAELMSDSIVTLEDFRKYPEQINANRTLQMTDLSDIWNLPYHSEHFGRAVAALIAFGKVEEKRTVFETFLRAGAKVELMIEDVQDPASKKRVQSLWGNFQTTTSEVQDLLRTVKDRMGAIRRPSRFARYTDRSDEVGLKLYQAVFTAPCIWNSVELDAENRMQALDQLRILYPNFEDLYVAKASLEELSALDLDFTEFHGALFRIPLALHFLDKTLEFKRAAFSTPPIEPAATLFSVPMLLTASILILTVWFFCGCTLDNSASTVSEKGQRGPKTNLFSRMVKQFKKMVRTAVMEKKMINLEKSNIVSKEKMAEINSLRESNRERRRTVKNNAQERIDAMARFRKENDDIARANEYKYNKNDDVDMYFYDPEWFVRNGFSTDAACTVPRVKMDINKTVLQGYFEWQLQKPGLMDDDLRVDRMGMCTMYPEMPLIRQTLAIDRHDEIRCCYHANIIIFPIYGRAIACMAPSGRTKVPYRDDIWLMITENKCKIIVMLCNLVEDGVVKCYPYFPDVIGRTKIYNGSKVTLDSQEEKFDGELIIRQITYQPVDPDVIRIVPKETVIHYQIPKWKEGSIPKTENQIEAVRFVYYATRRKSRTVPYVVHSSRGTGRACCFAAIDYIYQASCAKRRKLTLPGLVLQMRVMRYMAIETAEQLQFSFLMAYEAVVRDFKVNATYTLIYDNRQYLAHFHDMGQFNADLRKEYDAKYEQKLARIKADKTAKELSIRYDLIGKSKKTEKDVKAKSDEPKPEEPKQVEEKPKGPKPDETKPEEPKFKEATPEERTPEEAKPQEQKPVDGQKPDDGR